MSNQKPGHSHDCSLHTCWREVMAFDWSRMHHGICPKCHEDKFIGHGPLCTDCYVASFETPDPTPEDLAARSGREGEQGEPDA